MFRTACLLAALHLVPGLSPVEAQQGPPPAADRPASGTARTEPGTSADERWRAYAEDAVFSPGPYFATVMPALAEHARDEPEEYGGGWGGFGDRLGRRAAHYQLRTALYHSASAALGTETGYRRCGCTGGATRLGYALSRTFVTRTGSGAMVPNLAYLGSAYGAAVIAAEAWSPDGYRAAPDGVRAGTIQIGVHSAFNVLREFAPELKRLVGRP